MRLTLPAPVGEQVPGASARVRVWQLAPVAPTWAMRVAVQSARGRSVRMPSRLGARRQRQLRDLPRHLQGAWARRGVRVREVRPAQGRAVRLVPVPRAWLLAQLAAARGARP